MAVPFHEFRSTFELAGKYMLAGSSWKQFYKELVGAALLNIHSLKVSGAHDYEVRDMVTMHNSLDAEFVWHEYNRPYYKIFPALIPMFIDTRLDVPEEYFKVPFPSFVILFPENHGIESLCDDAGRPLRSIIVDNSEGKILIAIDGKDPEHIRQTVLWIDFGERVLLSDSPYISDIPEETRQIPGFDKAALPIYNYQLLKFKAGDTIETALDRQRKNHDPRFPLAVKAIEACVRMACAVCFLATGADKIIEPDILSKDLQRYLNDRENPEAVERLHGRARKRGKNGWTVGREYLFPSLPSSSDGDSESTGRHLKHQHQRRPHFHVVRHGSGKQLAKVVWFNQITVRPDLAPPTNKVRKGFVAK